MARRAPGRPGVGADPRRRTPAAGSGEGRPGGAARPGGTRAVRRCPAVPGEDPGRRRTAVAAGPSQLRAGRRGLRPRGPPGGAAELPGAQLPRPQPQARDPGGAAAVRGPGRIPPGGPDGRVAARAGGLRPGPLCQPALGSVRRRRAARAVHHLDHLAAARPGRPGARGARRRHQLSAFGGHRVRRGGPHGAGAGGALSRRRRGAGRAAAQPGPPAAGGGDLSAGRQPAHLSARRRPRGDGQLGQRASRRVDPEARRRARAVAGAELHPGHRQGSASGGAAGRLRAQLPHPGRGVRGVDPAPRRRAPGPRGRRALPARGAAGADLRRRGRDGARQGR